MLKKLRCTMLELKVDDGRAAATAYYLESNSDLCMELARSIDFMSYRS